MVNPVTDRATLLRNMEDRQSAETTMELLLSQQARLRYWECLQEHIAAQIAKLGGNATASIQPKVDPDAMTDEEAEHFQNTNTFSVGKHAGQYVTNVPIHYILWWSDGDAFTKNLRRYVRSRLFQRRQDAKEEMDQRERGQYREEEEEGEEE